MATNDNDKTTTTTISTTSSNDMMDMMMPVWISDNEIDPKWLQEKLHDPTIIQVKVKDISNDTRKATKDKDGATLKVTITRKDSGNDDDTSNLKPTTKTMIMKQTPPTQQASIQLSQSLGLAREALFYQKFGSILLEADVKIPKIYYSYGDYQTGLKCVLMEDLGGGQNYIDSGILFGPGNPNNWNRDLPKMIQEAYKDSKPPTAEEVTLETFRAIAKVHGKFWNDGTLLENNNDWLRGSSWIKGKSKESWEASQGIIQNIYSKGIDNKIEWDPLVKSVVDHVMSNISWEAQCQRLNSKSSNNNWTLVHGDFWPGNILISTSITTSSNINELKMLDWEMVGIGSGPQDLGQYILSNMSIEERRLCELRVVKAYYDELIKCDNVTNFYTFDECYKEYQIGGIERWLWFLIYFCGQESGSPLLKWAQFFHNQICAFIKDHNLQPNDFIQPRP